MSDSKNGCVTGVYLYLEDLKNLGLCTQHTEYSCMHYENHIEEYKRYVYCPDCSEKTSFWIVTNCVDNYKGYKIVAVSSDLETPKYMFVLMSSDDDCNMVVPFTLIDDFKKKLQELNINTVGLDYATTIR